MVNAVAHVALNCRDIDRSVDFYTRVLGLAYLFTQKRPDGSLFYVYLHAGGNSFVELFPTESAAPPEKRSGLVHVCFSVDDLSAALERVRREGWQVDSGPRKGMDGNLQAWLKDPDGVPVELMQMLPDCMQYKALGQQGIS